MNENTYRLVKATLAAIFIIGFLVIFHRFAENGRYQQHDYRMLGAGHSGGHDAYDTRTGQLKSEADQLARLQGTK